MAVRISEGSRLARFALAAGEQCLGVLDGGAGIDTADFSAAIFAPQLKLRYHGSFDINNFERYYWTHDKIGS